MSGNVLFRRWKRAASAKNAEIAGLLGVHPSRVWRWENTDARPDLVQRRLLERLSGGAVPVDAWLTKSEQRSLREGLRRIEEMAA